MHITSDQLEFAPPDPSRNADWNEEPDAGGELAKRPERFGWPVGKGLTFNSSRLLAAQR